jgi:AAA+ ATPase superfamily predicted ATPase
MGAITGREDEIELLEASFKNSKSEFVAVYGRRRVGKTFLIREIFHNKFSFHLTGLANATTRQQLQSFNEAFRKHSPSSKKNPEARSWRQAFTQLAEMLEKKREKRKVVFIDEMPWLDTPKSYFIQGLEHFWNSWASARKDILLIVCGSAASWMINKLINNHGGLHNRITQRIKIEPFTLKETKHFLEQKGFTWNHYQLIEAYSILGGIPFYLESLKKSFGPGQNIDKLFFAANALLRNEFKNLYASLFRMPANYIAVVEALSKKAKGLTRKELLASTALPDGGGITKVLYELEESGFIRRYMPFDKQLRESVYQLCDFYSLFYFSFISGRRNNDEAFWSNSVDNPKRRAWSGYAFEQVCLAHIPQIKRKLGISGVATSISVWRSHNKATAAQVDLVLERRDGIIHLFEMKFSTTEFVIDKKYEETLRNRAAAFRTETTTKAAIYNSMLTTYGVKNNMYAINVLQNDLTMDALFK